MGAEQSVMERIPKRTKGGDPSKGIYIYFLKRGCNIIGVQDGL